MEPRTNDTTANTTHTYKFDQNPWCSFACHGYTNPVAHAVANLYLKTPFQQHEVVKTAITLPFGLKYLTNNLTIASQYLLTQLATTIENQIILNQVSTLTYYAALICYGSRVEPMAREKCL
mmetsp:Transcript_13840/g.15274  ORF Transcript_13840/g.15274 Transcript_13840/m.15274 type:complete len:121 (-) Transcript_13840:83-445(-)